MADQVTLDKQSLSNFEGVFAGKKVVVLGHTGFKGTWMTLWLQQLGATVAGISDRIPTEPSHFEAADVASSMSSHLLDIRDRDALIDAVVAEEPDFVFHLAAQALVKASYDDPATTYEINAIGTANVLEALRLLTKPCTAVLITSDKCYDNRETYYGYREDDRLGGADPYSASKAAAEIIISSYYRSFFCGDDAPPVKLAVTRAGNVVGGGDWAADRLVPDIIRAWSKNENVTIRRPQATRPWQHVLEPVSGYLQLGAQLSNQSNLHGEAFNFGPSAAAVNPVRDVVTALQQHLPGLDLTIDESQAHFHEAGLLKLCCDKALQYLQWVPVLDFAETMELTAQWYERFYSNGADGITDFSYQQLDTYTRLASERGLSWARNVSVEES